MIMMKRATLIAALASQFILGIGAAAAGGTASLSGEPEIETIAALKGKIKELQRVADASADDSLKQKFAQLEEVHKDVIEKLKAKAKSEGEEPPSDENQEYRAKKEFKERMERHEQKLERELAQQRKKAQRSLKDDERYYQKKMKMIMETFRGQPLLIIHYQDKLKREWHDFKTKKESAQRMAEWAAVEAATEEKIYQRKMELREEMRNEIGETVNEMIEKMTAHREGRKPLSDEELAQYKKSIVELQSKMEWLKQPPAKKGEETPTRHNERMKRHEEKLKEELKQDQVRKRRTKPREEKLKEEPALKEELTFEEELARAELKAVAQELAGGNSATVRGSKGAGKSCEK
eukprot:CAMPEP_0172530750 /NCGR_PEP_ID=MMETSP1067-20121228/4383_1 /TAXON_ID=265564 ORGANISM="Thalassiosira punctigera, Strain Tpunct2005C2" /NCGR_SAMPLE_ID=MMETSP1067 /ASSEMBLY_ACC=CAM_ASM_000444 /LENGTH=348 /DNA_ID=CAMNT_0013315005 /DNA_START=66 /DNA_END=1113 /DNA_ORIENTATION=-